MAGPQQQTFTNVTPIPPPAQQQTFSDVTPVDASQAASGNGMGGAPLTDHTVPNARIRNMPNPVDPSWSPGRALYEGAKTGLELGSIPATIGQPVGSVVRGAIGATIGGAGAKVAAKATGAGDFGQEVAGDVGSLAGGALTEGLANTRVGQTAGKVIKGAAEDVPGVRQLGKLREYWDATAPEPIFKGAPEPATPPKELTQASSLYRGSGSPPDPAAGLGQIPRGSIAQEFKDPGASLPAAPSPELSQAGALARGAISTSDPAAGLGQIPVRGSIAGQMVDSVTKPDVQTSAPPIRRGSLQQMLNESLGAKQLQPNIPLRQQMDAAPPASGGDDMPDGHTAVKSSALRSYKYDPEAQEFHARANSGDTTYVYGGVSPEDAQAFEGADSKGKAWQQIRQNPLVAKIVNGKRIAVRPGAAQ